MTSNCSLATPQTGHWAGRILFCIGGALRSIPCYPGATLNCDRNIFAPSLIGNHWRLNYAKGFREPMVDVSFMIRDKNGEVLSGANQYLLYYLVTRSTSGGAFDAAFDSPVMAAGDGAGSSDGVVFWDGRSGFQLTCTKACDFVLSGSKATGAVGMSVRFSGTELRYIGSYQGISNALYGDPILSSVAANAITPNPHWSNDAPPVMFNHTSFLLNGSNYGMIAGENIWQYKLAYTNSCNPDMGLDGTVWAQAVNAGEPAAQLTLLAQAADDLSAFDNNDIYAILGGGSPANFGIRFNGPKTGSHCSFVVNVPIDQIADNRQINQGRIMRPHSYLCLGADGDTIGPLTVNSNYS